MGPPHCAQCDPIDGDGLKVPVLIVVLDALEFTMRPFAPATTLRCIGSASALTILLWPEFPAWAESLPIKASD